MILFTTGRRALVGPSRADGLPGPARPPCTPSPIRRRQDACHLRL